MSDQPIRLVPSPREKLWGATALEPWFRDSEKKIGEVWFLHPDGIQLPILVKFLYSTEPLSVQVHPPGKTEMWCILRAEPGARIALGLRHRITRDELRQAALSGGIEGLLQWFPASPGDVFLTPAGAIHSIGGGLALCEIQQNVDITYRLYDYGRPRELHVDKAVAVAGLEPHPGPAQPVRVSDDRELLVRCGHFSVERLSLSAPVPVKSEEPELLIVLEGSGNLGGTPFFTGDVWLLPPTSTAVPLDPNGSAMVLLAAPLQP